MLPASRKGIVLNGPLLDQTRELLVIPLPHTLSSFWISFLSRSFHHPSPRMHTLRPRRAASALGVRDHTTQERSFADCGASRRHLRWTYLRRCCGASSRGSHPSGACYIVDQFYPGYTKISNTFEGAAKKVAPIQLRFPCHRGDTYVTIKNDEAQSRA